MSTNLRNPSGNVVRVSDSRVPELLQKGFQITEERAPSQPAPEQEQSDVAIEDMTRDQLVAYAADAHGLELPGNVSKADAIDAILEAE